MSVHECFPGLEPIAPAVGSRVRGLDLGECADEGALAAIRRGVAERGVLVLRGQRLDVAALEALTAGLGTPFRVPWVRPMAGHPDVIEVLKEADETRISVFGGEWHSDFSSLERPPAYTLLYACEVPPTGGDTLFASGRAAWESLSEGMRRMLASLEAMHSGHVYGAAQPPTGVRTSRSIGISRGNPEADREVAHPVARLHPESGRRALFVNPIYTTRFAGMTVQESAPLLRFLYAHATRPEHTCRVRWTPGTLAIWDNRCTLHRALDDYDGRRRLLWRTTTVGERPFGALAAGDAAREAVGG